MNFYFFISEDPLLFKQMGLNCPSSLKKTQDSLPVINMIIVGFKYSGKSAILDRLGIDRQQTSSLDNSLGQKQLNISSFVADSKIKIITFELSSSAHKTWKHYYTNAHIILVVIDAQNLLQNQEEQFQKNRNAIEEVDEYASDICKVILVFNKMDKISGPSSSSITKILDLLSTFKHDMITVKCSAATGDGIYQLSQSISSIHKVISL